MTLAGVAVGLIAGGLLVSYLSWRWVFFVNVPIGLVVAALATPVLPESQRIRLAHPAGCATAWRPAAGDQKPRRSLTMIAVTRPGVITLLMMRMLFTPLGTP